MSDIRLHPLNPGFVMEQVMPPRLPVAVLDRIDAFWSAQIAERGNQIFDGPVFCMSDHTSTRIRFYPATYRKVLARRHAPEIFAGCDLPAPLGVTGLLSCTDGVVLGRRGEVVAVDDGLWEPVPSGGLAQPDPMEQVLLELQEELSLSRDEVAEPRIIGMVEDIDSGVFDLVFDISSRLSGESVLAAWQHCESREHDRLSVVPDARLSGFLDENHDNLLSALIPMLHMAGKIR